MVVAYFLPRAYMGLLGDLPPGLAPGRLMATIGRFYFRNAVCATAKGEVRGAVRCERWCL